MKGERNVFNVVSDLIENTENALMRTVNPCPRFCKPLPRIHNPCVWIWFVLRSRDSQCSIVTAYWSDTGMSLRYIQDEANIVFQSEICLFFINH